MCNTVGCGSVEGVAFIWNMDYVILTVRNIKHF